MCIYIQSFYMKKFMDTARDPSLTDFIDQFFFMVLGCSIFENFGWISFFYFANTTLVIAIVVWGTAAGFNMVAHDDTFTTFSDTTDSEQGISSLVSSPCSHGDSSSLTLSDDDSEAHSLQE